MAKISPIVEGILNGLAFPLRLLATQQLVDLLEKLYVKDKNAHSTVLNALYPAIDIHLEELTTKSKTKLDDAIIEAVKDAVTTSASAHNVVLPEFDKD